MVDGLQEKKQLVVVDLDGTLITGNSLHQYIRLGMRHLVRNGRAAKAARVAAMLMLRKLKMVTHKRMKWACLNLIGTDEALRAKLGNRLRSMLRPDVDARIEDMRAMGCKVLLATASFDFIADAMGYADFVATKSTGNPDRVECRGEVKVQAVKKYMEANHCGLHAVFTDHTDDLPLLLLPCPHRYLVHPSALTLTTVNALAIPYTALG